MYNKKFFRYIKELRNEKGITQDNVATALGISRVNYNKIERCLTPVEANDDFFTKLGEVLSVTPEDLQDKFLQFAEEEESSIINLDHLNKATRDIVTNPDYAQIVEAAIVEYLAKIALQSLKK